jgi:hypothetical protein
MPTPSFWPSIVVLSLIQGALVAVPGPWPWAARRLRRFRSGWWALIPAASLVLVAVGLLKVAKGPEGLTYLALIAVPVLAAAALGWAVRGARPWWAAWVVPLFAVAWAWPSDLAGQTAALALSALSCVSLGVVLVAVAPPLIVRIGVYAMAIADVVLVVADQLQRPSTALGLAHPVAQLPRLQSVVFGSALMGYGDLFIAALVGALLVARPAWQVRAALVVMGLAVIGDLAFLRIHEFPATVPVALGLLIVDAWGRIGPHTRRADPVSAPARRRTQSPSAPPQGRPG